MTQVEEFITLIDKLDSLDKTVNISLETERNAYLGCIAHSLAIIADALTKETNDEK